MRELRMATCRLFLKKPKILGLEAESLLTIIFLSGVLLLIFPESKYKGIAVSAAFLFSYVAALTLSKLVPNPSIKAALSQAELWASQFKRKRQYTCEINFKEHRFPLLHPDTADTAQVIKNKNWYHENLLSLKENESIVLFAENSRLGAHISEIEVKANPDWIYADGIDQLTGGLIADDEITYSLSSLPAHIDPFWICSQLNPTKNWVAVIRAKKLKQKTFESRLEGSRKRLSLPVHMSIEEESTKLEATEALQSIIRGDEAVLEFEMIIATDCNTQFDSRYFRKLSSPLPALASAFGFRKHMENSQFIRGQTSADLIPSILDPNQETEHLDLVTRRGKPAYFNPAKTLLNHPHLLICGSTGSGKSFFAGLMLKRLVSDARIPSAAVFIDHGYSFKNLIKNLNNEFIAPEDISELEASLSGTLSALKNPGQVVGIELSELTGVDKAKAAKVIFNYLASFLRKRSSSHRIFIVFDECWKYLSNDSSFIEEAFREFRKYNASAVAITQSLSDFRRSAAGDSIFQNAGTKLLLRQSEDPAKYQAEIELNDKELNAVRNLETVNGEYSECLIKQGCVGLVARVVPTPSELALFGSMRGING